MNTLKTNTVNGFDLVQVKNALPQIVKCATEYKNLTLLAHPEQQELLLSIIISTIRRVRRYKSTKVTDLAKLVRLLYGVQKNDSIQIKYNGRTKLDFPQGETTQLLFDTLNQKLATIYSPEKMMEFYHRLYPELLWSEEGIKTPVDNEDVTSCLFEYSASKHHKRIIVEFENDDDIDIRLYKGYKFKDDITPYYAKSNKGEFIQPTGFTLKGIKTILAIELTLQKRENAHYVGALLYTLGVELQRVGIYERASQWFTNEQYAFLYDIAGTLGVINEEFVPTYNPKEKETFVKKEMIKYNKYMISKKDK